MTLFSQPDFVIVSLGALVGIASSLLGSFLVLRRNSMLADAISHSILLGIVLVFLITKNQFSPFFVLGASLVGVLTVFLTELAVKTKRVKDDAAIGLVYPFLFAIAILLINIFARNVHIDTDAVLLGEIGFAWIDTVRVGGVEVAKSLLNMSIVTAINLLFILLFYKELKLSTFDPGLASALGFTPSIIFYALLSLTSVTAVVAFDAVGAILLVAFIIVPPATAYLLTDKLWHMLFYGSLISIAASLLGYAGAIVFNVSIGGMMASFTGLFFFLAFILSPKYGLLAQEMRRKSLAEENLARTLAVHLYNHQDLDSEEANKECHVTALDSHLGWSQGQIDEILSYSIDNHLVNKNPSGHLRLTRKGIVYAQEVLEPWLVNN